MRTLSATLLAAQKKASHIPFVEAKVYDYEQGIKRLSWDRLYEGSEPDNHHGIAFDSQGSMHRIRAEHILLPYQKITNPGPDLLKLLGSDDQTADGHLAANRFFCCQFTAEASGTMARFKLKCDGAGNVKVAIYANNNGEPGALLNAVNTAQAVSAGWNTITFPDTAITQGTVYWLAIISDVAIVGYYTADRETRNKAATFSTFTFPDPAPSMARITTLTHLLAGFQPGTDYSQWLALGLFCPGPCAIASYGAKIYIFHLYADNVLAKTYSHDYGATWQRDVLVDYPNAKFLAACWWGTSDIVVCFALKSNELNAIVLDTSDQSSSQHIQKFYGAVTHTLLDTYGIGASYCSTMKYCELVFAAKESDTPYSHHDLWRTRLSSTYHFLALESFIMSPEGEDITYEYPDCHLPLNPQSYESTHILAVEKFAGTSSYQRPLTCHLVKGTYWSQTTFTEPKPFLNISSDFGLRIMTSPDHWWLERPDGIWRALRMPGPFNANLKAEDDQGSIHHVLTQHIVTRYHKNANPKVGIGLFTPGPAAITSAGSVIEIFHLYGNNVPIKTYSLDYGVTWKREILTEPLSFLDLSHDIISLNQRIPGNLTLELDNHNGQYANPGSGALAVLRKRSEVVLKLGYKTSQGDEASEAGTYWVDGWEYSITQQTQSTLKLFCLDGWGLANKWSARFQMRWNKDNVGPKSVWQILSQILARWGIRLTNTPPKPQSSASLNFYPDFTIHPGTAGDSAIRSLLSFVPDKLVFRGQEAFTKNPLANESSCYSYGMDGSDHGILSGVYPEGSPASRARAIGRDEAGNRIVQDAFDWDLLKLYIDILEQDYDPNLTNTTRAQERADAILRKHALEAMGGQIIVPTNVGQELLDIITLTDKRCGISSQNYRVTALQTNFSTRSPTFSLRIDLSAP